MHKKTLERFNILGNALNCFIAIIVFGIAFSFVFNLFGPISEEKAQKIAEDYWIDFFNEPDSNYMCLLQQNKTGSDGNEYYYYVLTTLVRGHRTTIDYLFIDTRSGDTFSVLP